MTEKEVLEIIEKAAREGATELDLSDLGIKLLPGEIGKLTKLTEINLRGNDLISIPKELGRRTRNKIAGACRSRRWLIDNSFEQFRRRTN